MFLRIFRLTSSADPAAILVAGAAAGLVLTALGAVLLIHLQSPPTSSTPKGTVEAFLTALADRRDDRAVALMAPEVFGGPQGVAEREEFRSSVRAGAGDVQDAHILQVTRTEDTARVDVLITAVQGGLFTSTEDHRLEITLRRAASDWLITSPTTVYAFQ